jgi:1-acyl-sn-glycerol-3-phosphate acyltransferase
LSNNSFPGRISSLSRCAHKTGKEDELLPLIKTILIFIPVVGAVVVLVPIGILVFIFSCIGLRKPASRVMYLIARGWARMIIGLSGCTVTVTGQERIPRQGGLCVVSNHGSIYDILLALAYIGRPFGFIAKKELAYIPLLNMWIYVLGGLFIDRKNIRSAVKTINKGVKRIKAGEAMIIFPEGHRSRGQGLLPFHSGSLKLATQADSPVVPMALAGSYAVFEKTYRLNPGPLAVSFGAPIPTAGLPPADRKQALADRIRGIIAEMLDRNGGESLPARDGTL